MMWPVLGNRNRNSDALGGFRPKRFEAFPEILDKTKPEAELGQLQYEVHSPLCLLFPHRTKLNGAFLTLLVHYMWPKWPLEPFSGGGFLGHQANLPHVNMVHWDIPLTCHMCALYLAQMAFGALQ